MTTVDPTQLQRVILPRSGDPMSVRALYMDERSGLALATVPALPGAVVTSTVHLEGSAVTGRRLRGTARAAACLPRQNAESFRAYLHPLAAGHRRRRSPPAPRPLPLRLGGHG